MNAKAEKLGTLKSWPKAALGQVCDLRDGPFGSKLKTAHYSNGGARVIRLQNIGANEFLDHDKAFVPLDYYEELREHDVRKDDVLVASLGDGPRPAGRACVMPDLHGPAIVKADCFRARPDSRKLDPDFLCFFMNSNFGQEQVQHFVMGATRPRLTVASLRKFQIPLPLLDEQKRIVGSLTARLSAVERATAATRSKLLALEAERLASVAAKIADHKTTKFKANECLYEITNGIGDKWKTRPVYGATREGIEIAREKVGKQPERYKPVERETVFYNPMRILIGSIAILDDGRPPGITSPDYVVVRGKDGLLHGRFLYDWLRSPFGADFIESLARGAVRERLMFKRLTRGEIPIPPWPEQLRHVALSREIDKARSLTQEQRRNLEALRSALLRAAFSGQL